MFRRLLVAFDGSDGSWKALRSAIALAKLKPGAELWALSVEELADMPEVIDETLEEREGADSVFGPSQKEALALAAEEGVTLNLKTIAGHPAQAIVHYARKGEFDLLVVGHRGHSGVWGNFLGGTAGKIVRHATCNVLVVR